MSRSDKTQVAERARKDRRFGWENSYSCPRISFYHESSCSTRWPYGQNLLVSQCLAVSETGNGSRQVSQRNLFLDAIDLSNQTHSFMIPGAGGIRITPFNQGPRFLLDTKIYLASNGNEGAFIYGYKYVFRSEEPELGCFPEFRCLMGKPLAGVSLGVTPISCYHSLSRELYRCLTV
jgi:hypothetical protein